MEKPFSELIVGTKFTINNVEYVKTDEVRVSCCRSVNCQMTADSSQRTFIPAEAIVTVNG